MSDGHHEAFRRVASPFEGRLVRLRAIEESDLPRMNELIWVPEVTRHLAAIWPQALAGSRAWWERGRAAEDERHFAIETLAGELLGNCGLRHIDPSSRWADMGIFIGAPYWNQGFGTDAVRTLCRFSFKEMNLRRVELSVFEDNLRARRAYEKVGFKEEGRLLRAHFAEGRYVDVIVMGLLAEDLIED